MSERVSEGRGGGGGSVKRKMGGREGGREGVGDRVRGGGV